MGTLGLAAFVFKMLAVDYPDGDPDGARQAAKVWARLAERIEQSPHNTYPSAEAVWKKNEGEGVEAFKKAMTSKLYTEPAAASFPGRLALLCRRNSEACAEYAEIIETAQHAYRTAAWANFASFVFITTFPWQNAAAGHLTKILIRRAEATIFAKLIAHAVARTVLTKLTVATLGSVSFAVGDVATVAGVRALRGEDPGSFKENAVQALKEFTASMAFYGVSEAATPVVNAMTKNAEVQGFLGRIAGGSFGYGPTYDLLNGERGGELAPTWEQTLGRALLYFTMAHKKPTD
ncbi:WXG100-like domain-containing protein [Streptosporangium sp. NBC_01469]|uniref:WXG100-like domain-containing protein n=1 Tax=Streptosporangium sp. NBC_01469 TaxID=2903898 RepID=UPI002E2BA380|nr:hypothetical protein [Streptosporangium sp. NBC_01469]